METKQLGSAGSRLISVLFSIVPKKQAQQPDY